MALLNCNFCSSVLGKNTAMTVILPEHRHQPRKEEDRKYPVLYALHGLGHDHTQWQRYGTLESLLENEEVIVVMPDCGKSFYTDGKHGYEYFTFLTEELPLIVGNYFPASRKREDTYIAGISMGGYGALKAALWRPDLYAKAAALSPAADPPAVAASLKNVYTCRDQEDNISSIFGAPEEFYGSYNNLFKAVDRYAKNGKWKLPFFICCGEQEPLYKSNVELAAYMGKAGISATFVGGEGGHNWEYWNKMMPHVLKELGVLTGKGPADIFL